MEAYRKPANRLDGLEPYDPKFMPANAYLSANESPDDLSEELRSLIQIRMNMISFNRYPDPLANELRDQIAHAHGLKREQVIIGNGGDELLFNYAVIWGGTGRKFLNLPPTFSVYEGNARITNTQVVNIPRKDDFEIDEEAVFERVAEGDIDFMVVASPNNPTGSLADISFVMRLLDSTDAMVLIDEAYFEFAGISVAPYLSQFKNMIVLRTLSKAYSLAGVRLGYILANPEVINEFIKVRQPYSVNSISQMIGSCVYENKASFEDAIGEIVDQRDLVFEELSKLDQITAYPSDANFILFKVDKAPDVWESLYNQGVLVRDFSRSEALDDCLRVTIGSARENQRFLAALKQALAERDANE